VADRGDSYGLVIVCQLVDDAICAYAQRAQAGQPPAEGVSAVGVALEESERVLDGVDERPVEIEQLVSGAPRENDLGHASAGGATLGEVLAKFVERDGLASCELAEACFDGQERV
jgi:hypothetical protein